MQQAQGGCPKQQHDFPFSSPTWHSDRSAKSLKGFFFSSYENGIFLRGFAWLEAVPHPHLWTLT